MKRALATAVAAAGLFFAGSAGAATYVDPWTTSPSGAISVVFGDNGLGVAGAESIVGETTTTHVYDAGTGAFTDTFSFFLPDGIVGFTLSSIGFAANSSISDLTVTFNGENIAVTPVANGQGGFSFNLTSDPFAITLGGAQNLVIAGIGGADAVFSGTATFEPSAGVIPEPGAWALMIVGFGGAGALLRRKRATVQHLAA